MRPLIALTASEKEARLWLPRTYFRAVEQSGALPAAVDLSAAIAQDIADRFDALLLTGGGDLQPALYGQAPHPKTGDLIPARDEAEIALVRAFTAAQKPILAICRGIQVLAVALGGTLHQHVPDLSGVRFDHGDAAVRHAVSLREGSRLRAIYRRESVQVNSTHHQAVHNLPGGFQVAAVSEDGVLEAIEGGCAIGVQWHPERLYDQGHACLFDAFVRSAAAGHW